jgi:DNA-binding PadR family transcriptional regulator
MARKSSLDSGILNDSAFYILSTVITEKHGYLIMKLIEEKTNGQVMIGPASLYTTLKKLLDAELIMKKETSDDSTKIYEITPRGLEVLEKDIQRKNEMIQFARYFIENKEEDSNES